MTQGIYTITHRPTGRIYVGQSKNIEHRWRTHQSASAIGKHSNKALQAAVSSDGWDAFELQIVELVEDPKRLGILEEEWIRKLGTESPEKGFNVSRHHEDVRSMQPLSPVLRAQMRAAMAEQDFTVQDMAGELGHKMTGSVEWVLDGRTGVISTTLHKMLRALGFELVIRRKQPDPVAS